MERVQRRAILIEEECKYKVEEIETLRGLYRGKAKELEEKCENQAEELKELERTSERLRVGSIGHQF